MTSGLIFVGHVSIDRVENVNGVQVQPGGAALYAAMAARTLIPDVCLISVVGRDYQFVDVLDSLGSEHVKVYNLPSTSFHIRYNERWEARYLKAVYGAGNKITSSILPLNLLGTRSMVHLSPMKAGKVANMVNKIKEGSPDTMVSVNTWIDYIGEGRKSREALRELASRADLFILNDSEAKALTQTDSISTALRLLKAKKLVVTLGELGAIISGENGIQMVPALSLPMGRVVDTTGAGDAWCGAFLAAYKLTGDLMKSVTVASIISRIKCSDWGLNKLINLRFREPDDVIEYVIGLREGSLQKRISDYIKGKHESNGC